MRLSIAMAISIAVSCSITCTRDVAVAPLDRDLVSIGTWGGDNAGFIVTDSVAHLHIGCTFGDIAGRIRLDGSGSFVVDGTYQPRAYPIMVGPSVPARFTGVVQGRRLTVSVVVNDTVDKTTRHYGPATVVFGDDPRLGPCPICRVPGMR